MAGFQRGCVRIHHGAEFRTGKELVARANGVL
jgi:hypothetical protein